MPDITMCKNKLCPKRQSCYRYRATPDRLQSYSSFVPVMDEVSGTWECDYFSRVRREDKVQPIEE